MRLVDQDIREIFRFEYHPVADVPHRFRIIVSTSSGDLKRVTEQQTRTGWSTVDTQEIDYFEFSDEDLESELE